MKNSSKLIVISLILVLIVVGIWFANPSSQRGSIALSRTPVSAIECGNTWNQVFFGAFNMTSDNLRFTPIGMPLAVKDGKTVSDLGQFLKKGCDFKIVLVDSVGSTDSFSCPHVNFYEVADSKTFKCSAPSVGYSLISQPGGEEFRRGYPVQKQISFFQNAQTLNVDMAKWLLFPEGAVQQPGEAFSPGNYTVYVFVKR